MDLALNNLQRLICNKTKQTKPTKPANHSIQYYSFVCTLSNDSKYCCVISMIQFRLGFMALQVI